MKTKRLLGILTALLMLFTLLPVTASADDIYDVWDGTRASGFGGGSGSVNEPFIITTGGQLAYLSDRIATGLNTMSHFRLAGNIDLDEHVWKPIGDSTKLFKGTFDGCGYTIKGLKISKSDGFSGLFGNCENATIKNLKLTNANINDDFYNIGGLVGRFSATGTSTATIENCSVSGSIIGGDNGWLIGGVAGCLTVTGTSTAIIKNCFAEVSVSVSGSESSNYVGGVVGSLANNAKMEGCYATGSVTGTYQNIGGVVGEVTDGSTVQNCYATGAVTGGNYIGGVTGNVAGAGALVQSCYATGDVEGGSLVGGIAGVVQIDDATVKNCYATGDVEGDSLVGGAAGVVIDDGVVEYCYATGDVSGEDAVGGVVGHLGVVSGGSPLPGNVRYCAALGRSVTISNGSHTGKVAGVDWTGTLTGNNYFGGMECATIGQGSDDGGAMSGTDAYTADFWTTPSNWGGGIWDSDVWQLEDDHLPVLKNMDITHIQPDQFLPIAYATITTDKTSYTYTGSPITPAVTVKLGSRILVKGTDYTVTYSDNTDIGTATITVAGTGAYSGTATVSFVIVDKTAAPLPQTNSGTAPAPNTIMDGGNIVTTPKDHPPVTDKDGNITLPGGGTVETPGGGVIDVPPGTTIDKGNNISIPPDKDAGMTLPGGGKEITLPGGSSISPAGDVTLGGDMPVDLPSGKTIDLPKGSVIGSSGNVTVGAGGATVTLGNATLSIAEDTVLIFDDDIPLGYLALVSSQFADVKDNDWFYEYVLFAYTHGLMGGTSTDTMLFSPNMPLTRGMLVTILHRVADSPDVSELDNAFGDVAADKYYTDAVSWAAANSIVTGYDGVFNPETNITRQDLAMILWRFAKSIGTDVSAGEDTNILSYDDAFDVSEYAVSAIQWACGAGVMSGRPDGLLDPQGSATRAEASAMLCRFLAQV